jgi:Cu/Ag efflux pump CusA
MTTLVTALGLAPLAAGMAEPGREVQGPMAMVILGGLFSSLLLNLLVLPTLTLRFGSFANTQASHPNDATKLAHPHLDRVGSA